MNYKLNITYESKGLGRMDIKMKLNVTDKLEELYQQEEVIRQAQAKREQIKKEALKVLIAQYSERYINNKEKMQESDILNMIEMIAIRGYDIGSK
jgi:hypothetical protein